MVGRSNFTTMQGAQIPCLILLFVMYGMFILLR